MVVSSVRVIVSPSSCHEGEFCSSGFPMHVHLVLVGLNFILHFVAYDSHIFISFCSPVVVVLKRFMSSAYAITLNLKSCILTPFLFDLRDERRSFMKTLNSLGDRILPCLMPFEMLNKQLSSPAHLA
ncbi:unnamed protein product [Meganyctiphanes norvegica]|uniref:Uncharacterized protein n=1 Tax=Meganyctiphanes norvegica TaxID=48144 RepID=A0AAV2Q548_MEGNR